MSAGNAAGTHSLAFWIEVIETTENVHKIVKNCLYLQ